MNSLPITEEEAPETMAQAPIAPVAREDGVGLYRAAPTLPGRDSKSARAWRTATPPAAPAPGTRDAGTDRHRRPDSVEPATLRQLSCLQIGVRWFSEQPGGLERYYHDLLRYLPGASIFPTGLVAGSDRAVVESGGSVHPFSSAEASIITRLRGMRRAAFAHRSEQFDVIASHFALYGLPALGAYRGVPWVIHFHGPWAAEARANHGGRLAARLKHAVEQRVYEKGSRFIALSQAFGRILSEQYRVPAERVRVVPGGVDAARFMVTESRAEARAALGWPLDRPIVVSVRRLVPRMGLENLVDAAARRSLRDVLFVIVGRGALADSLKQQAIDAGAEHRVMFCGHVPDDQLPLIYRAADLTIVPSVTLEGFGLTVAESLAAGTPTLVTRVGGLPEVVEDLSPELVTEGSGADAIAEALRRVLFSPATLPDSTACRDYATSRFDWRVIARRVRDVYEEAIGAG